MKTDPTDPSFASPSRDRGLPRRWWRYVFAVLAVVVIGAACVYAFAPQYAIRYLPQYVLRHMPQLAAQTVPGGRRGARAGTRGDTPVPVLAAVAKQADVPVYFDGVGSSRALNTVTVRAQVDGKLMSVNFKEGQDVDQDFVLAEIDSTIYQAQYDQAVAKKAMDDAQLANARLDLDRYARLAQTNSASHQQYDTQKALVAQLEAQVQLDQGAIENVKATLSYTKIIAPLAGRTGIRLVDAGNIVHAVDTTGIVVITQVRPIAIIFTLPQQQLAQVNKAFAKGALDVRALGDDNRTVVDRGKLVVVDNQVDQTTGTVKLKAEFPNTDLQLWPGQFVNVKLLVDTLKQVTVVPTAAVQRGPNGTFVYVANDDNTVTVRPVTVAQQDDTEAVISTGDIEGARVVTTGFSQLTDGARISIGTQEDLQRPAGSERRRAPRRPATTAQAGETSSPTAAVPSVDARRAATPSGTSPSANPAAQAAETPAGEGARGSRQRARSGGPAALP